MKKLLAGLALAVVFGTSMAADSWPSKPIRVVVPFPPGSSPDLVARMLTEKLTVSLGQPVIVDNKPGSGGNIGTGLVAKAAPDGYTLGLSIPGPLAVNTVLYSKMDYDPFTELAAVSLVAVSPNVLVADPKLNIGSVKEFIALARAQPGKLNYGSIGNGSSSHLTMELLKTLAGLDVVHVPYPGSPQVIAAIVGGQVQVGFVVPGTAMALVQAGRLKAIAVTSADKSQVLPDLPTVAEAGYAGFESSAWLGMVAPAGTPKPIVERLSRELMDIIRSPEVQDKMVKIYFQPVGTSPETLSNLMRAERDRWAPVIKRSGARAD